MNATANERHPHGANHSVRRVPVQDRSLRAARRLDRPIWTAVQAGG